MQLNVKQLYVPGTVVRTTCPKCGREVERDLALDYLQYPKVNEPGAVAMSCDEEIWDPVMGIWRKSDCQHKWTVQLVVTVDVAPAPGEDGVTVENRNGA